MRIINILRGLSCRLPSLRLKFTNEPSIFVDGDLAESIKRSASGRLAIRCCRFEPGLFQVFFTTFGFSAFKICLDTHLIFFMTTTIFSLWCFVVFSLISGIFNLRYESWSLKVFISFCCGRKGTELKVECREKRK